MLHLVYFSFSIDNPFGGSSKKAAATVSSKDPKQRNQNPESDDQQSASHNHGRAGKREWQCQKSTKNQLSANEIAGKCSNKDTQIQNNSTDHQA